MVCSVSDFLLFTTSSFLLFCFCIIINNNIITLFYDIHACVYNLHDVLYIDTARKVFRS